MTDIAIKVEGLSKKYKIGKKRSGDLRETVNLLLNKFKGNEKIQEQIETEFWALQDVNFEIKQGEAVGVIGRNGAGKSTLLKILSRITEPTTGRIEINGRVSSLLEVGTGFHPELTGRENIFLNGTILGMRRREVREKFDEIVDFSGVEKFIDTPIKHYSSGMKVRLAFSVAAHLEPEILLIDEVLAVGDAEFQKKCLGKMEDVTGAGRTVLFVSHNMASVSHLCSLGLFLESGNLKTNDSIGKVIERYLYDGKASNELLLSERKDRIGGEIFKFTDIKFFDQNSKNKVISLYSGMDLEIHLYYKSTETLRNIVIRIQVYNQKGHTIATFNNYHCDQPFKQISKKGLIVCSIPKLPFYDGTYTISLSCLRNMEVIDHIDNAIHINIEEGDYFGTGKLPLTKDGVLIENKWNLVKC